MTLLLFSFIRTTRQSLLLRATLSKSVRSLSVVHGDLNKLAPKVRKYIEENVAICQPDKIHICDGSERENKMLLETLEKAGMAKRLTKYENW